MSIMRPPNRYEQNGKLIMELKHKRVSADDPTVSHRQRRIAVLALFAALAAGLIEMAAQLWPLDNLGADSGSIVVRLFIYAAVAVLIVLFSQGREWARMTLLVGLGVIGTASLILEPLAWLFDEPDFGAFFAALDLPGAVILFSRLAHIAAVFVGVFAMIKLRPTRKRASQSRRRAS